jgi:hypothetical protein
MGHSGVLFTLSAQPATSCVPKRDEYDLPALYEGIGHNDDHELVTETRHMLAEELLPIGATVEDMAERLGLYHPSHQRERRSSRSDRETCAEIASPH